MASLVLSFYIPHSKEIGGKHQVEEARAKRGEGAERSKADSKRGT
jgi:hypothetical protein